MHKFGRDYNPRWPKMMDWHAIWIEDLTKMYLRKLREGTATPQTYVDRLKYPVLKEIKQAMLAALAEYGSTET